MWIVFIPAYWRCSAPPRCIRQLLSSAVQNSVPVPNTSSSFTASIAEETSPFFTLNVPPNPQQRSRFSSGEGQAHAPSSTAEMAGRRGARLATHGSSHGRSPDGKVRAHILHTQLVHQKLAQLEDLGSSAANPLRSPSSPISSKSDGYWSRIIATHDEDGITTASYSAYTAQSAWPG